MPQARWAVYNRADLVERLEEFANRRNPVDDVANCWRVLSPSDRTATPQQSRSSDVRAVAVLRSILDAVADEVRSRGA